MARCYICGKDIGILDSTTSFYTQNGTRTEVHTACYKGGAQAEVFQTFGPEMFAPTYQDPVAEVGATVESALSNISPRTLYIAGGVVAAAIIVGLIIGVARR